MARLSAMQKAMEDFLSSKKQSVQKKMGATGQKISAYATAINRVKSMKGKGGGMSTIVQKEPLHIPPTQRELNQMRVLRKNVFDQYNFTPQARQRLQKIPIRIDSAIYENPRGFYSHPNRSTEQITLNRNILNDKDKFLPAEVLTHEYTHALDNNAHQYNTNYPGSSSGFYQSINKPQTNPSNPYEGMQRFIRGGYDAKNPYIRDVESFAYQSGQQGQNALLGSSSNYFKNIFLPSTPNLNYSPMYLARPIYNYPLSQLFGEK